MAMLGNPISIMDFPVDYFTGDGTSTTFQLSRIPASATSILVHIGGVKQVASTTDPAYYLDGSQLVLAAAPAAHSPIEVNYLGIAGQVNIPGVQSITQSMLSLQLANTFVYQTTANGAVSSFTLNAPPVSANSLVVSANGIVQHDYSVNGTNLQLGFTPSSGTLIRVTSLALAQAGVPSDGSVTSVKLGANLTLTGNTSFDGFSGNGARIRGDMSNATLSNRLAFQTSTTNAATSLVAITNGTGTNCSFNFYNNSDPTNAGGLTIGTLGSGTEASIRSSITGTGTYLPLTIFTGGSERMRIDTSGNVGIGLTSPTYKLDVSGANAQSIRVISTNGDLATLRMLSTGNNEWSIASDVVMRFRKDATEYMRIDVNGNVGVGVVPVNAYTGLAYKNIELPKAAFYAFDVTGSRPVMGLRSNVYFDASANFKFIGNGFATQYQTDEGNHIWLSSGNNTSGAEAACTLTERMRIDSSGRVGIGTSSPDTTTLLTVAGAVTITGFNTGHGASRLKLGQDTAAISQLRFYGADNSTPGVLQFTGSSADGNVGGERMRIDSSGNVGIGTTNPANARLRVNQPSGEFGAAKPLQTWAYAAFQVTNLHMDGSVNPTWNTDADSTWNPPATMIWQFRGTERMRIDSAGRVTTPSQPAFHAVRNAGNVSSTGIYICNAVTYNDGSHYNSSTGRFTAPVAGRYQLNFFVLAQNGNSFDIIIRVNGSQYPGMDIRCNSGTGGNFTLSVSAVLKLSANDIVDPFISALPSGPVYGLGLSGFSMYLLG